MLGAKETISFFGKIVRLGVLFELINDPNEAADTLAYKKAVDVWLWATNKHLPADQFTLDTLQKQGQCIRSVTMSTPPELRQYSIATFQSGYLHVIVTPVAEWSELYDDRKYSPVDVKGGRVQNFAVSLPPKVKPLPTLSRKQTTKLKL